MTVAEVSEATKFRPQTIRNQISSRTFPIPSHRSGGHRLFHIADVASYIDLVAGLGSVDDTSGRRRGRPTKAEQIRKQERQGAEADGQ